MDSPLSMQISLRLGEYGWSDLDLWLGDKRHEFCITHLFNSPFVEMANTIFSLSQDAKEASFTLLEEPGQHIWSITQIPDAHHVVLVEIRSYEETSGVLMSPIETIEFRVARDFFLENFLLEFEKISVQLQNPSFAKNRDTENFPWDTLKEIRRNRPKVSM